MPADPVEVTAPVPVDEVATAREAVARAIAAGDTGGHCPAGEDVRRDQLNHWHHGGQLTEPSHEDDQTLDRDGHDHGAGA